MCCASAISTRPNIFARHIVLPEQLYGHIVEIDERLDASGEIVTELDEASARAGLEQAWAQGFRALAIVLIAWLSPQRSRMPGGRNRQRDRL